MKAWGKADKSEKCLLGLTALFLCLLLALHLRDRQAAAVVPEVPLPQAALLPDMTPLDINTATAEELTELPGIGPELAARIVEHRTAHGPFAAVEEILEVPGIGEGKLEAIEERITVNGEDTR